MSIGVYVIPKQRSSKIAKFRKIESIVTFRALQPGIILVAIPAEIKKLKIKKMNPNTAYFYAIIAVPLGVQTFVKKKTIR